MQIVPEIVQVHLKPFKEEREQGWGAISAFTDLLLSLGNGNVTGNWRVFDANGWPKTMA